MIASRGGALLQLIFNDGTDISAAAAAAASADVAIVFAGTLSSEGSDRESLSLDTGGPRHEQNNLIAEVAARQSNTVVVLSVPGAIITPWSPSVAAILVNFMPGEGVGGALVDLLLGDVNPSAKLPLTFPNIENETALTPAQWPGVPNAEAANYSETLFIGYRYYDSNKIDFTTGFPFGHGLSYTTFAYSELRTSVTSAQHLTVSLTVENTGTRDGAEIVQLYLGFPPSAGEPPKVLRAFNKAVVAKGKTTSVQFELNDDARSIYDISSQSFKASRQRFAP